MQQIEQLIQGNFYHIYNHGVASRDLFYTPDNYEYFLDLYSKYIHPIADTYAWVLMKNHFHLLLQIKEVTAAEGIKTPMLNPSNQFSKLFNSYAQAINKRLGCHGALFERPFKRKRIDTEEYLKNVLLYIHNNPVIHGFCDYAMDYPWSSYLTCMSGKPTKLKRDTVMEWFGSEEQFKTMHSNKFDLDSIEEWLDVR